MTKRRSLRVLDEDRILYCCYQAGGLTDRGVIPWLFCAVADNPWQAKALAMRYEMESRGDHEGEDHWDIVFDSDEPNDYDPIRFAEERCDGDDLEDEIPGRYYVRECYPCPPEHLGELWDSWRGKWIFDHHFFDREACWPAETYIPPTINSEGVLMPYYMSSNWHEKDAGLKELAHPAKVRGRRRVKKAA